MALTVSPCAFAQSADGPGAGSETSVPATDPVVGELYLDQTLDVDDEPELDEARVREEEEDVIGRRFVSHEYRMAREDSTDGVSSFEQGVAMRASRETIAYGTFTFDGEARYEADDGLTDDSAGVRFTFGQDGFVLSDRLTADSTLGDLRATTDRGISSSFRFTLPSSIVRGVNTRIYSENGELRATAGRVGRLDGFATRGFEDTGAFLWGLGHSRRIGERWELGVQGWSLSDDDTLDDHASFSGFVEYSDRDGIGDVALRALQDTEGNLGIWVDGDTLVERWRHRYGVFRFDPALRWTDVQIPNDRQGFYWRGDRRTFRRTWSLGLDFEQTNIDSDRNLAGANAGRAYANMNWRVRRRTGIGSFAAVDVRRPSSGIDIDSTEDYSLTGFVNHDFDIGTTRVQASFDALRGGPSEATGYGLVWDQDWEQPLLDRLDTTLGFERVNGDREDTNAFTFGASFAHSVTPALSLTGNASFVVSDSDEAGDNDAANVNLGAFWQISRNWQLDLSAALNDNVFDPVDDGKLSRTDHRVLLTLRYTRARGRPARVLGRETEGSGTGRISGRVFFDENRDGRWSPNEPGADGIMVLLNRRGARATNADGTFELAPVFVGEHALTIAVEDLPLPWGLEDESPRSVRVSLRGVTEVDFALIRLDE